MSTLATGTTGTIGRHLPSSITGLPVDLSLGQNTFKRIHFDHSDDCLHLAGIVGATEVNKDPDYAYSVNVSGTKFLAEQFLEKSQGKFYYVSTSHVYAKSDRLITEKSDLMPINIYAEQKLMAESELLSIFTNSLERLCIIRVFSVLDWDVGRFTLGGGIRKIVNKEPNYKLYNGNDIRDFLTPRSIANVLYEITNFKEISGIVNLCTGIGTTVGDAAKRMILESGFQIPENKIESGNSDFPSVVGSNQKLLNALPSLNLEWNPAKYFD
jgi:nucleoside-diphosphate-sugar epimerase